MPDFFLHIYFVDGGKATDFDLKSVLSVVSISCFGLHLLFILISILLFSVSILPFFFSFLHSLSSFPSLKKYHLSAIPSPPPSVALLNTLSQLNIAGIRMGEGLLEHG